MGAKLVGRDISQQEYREAEGLSASDCKALLDDAYAYKMGIRPPKSKALGLGSAIHCLVLEPHNFERDFIVMPEDLNARTKEGKALKAELEQRAEAERKELISSKDFAEASKVAEAVLGSEIGDFFKNGFAEQSYFGEVFGRPAKCRPDYFLEQAKIVIDLKTTAKGGSAPEAFAKACASYNYHLQARFYMELLGAERFLFVAVEKEAPYRIGCYELDIHALELGKQKIERAYGIYDRLEEIQQIRRDSEGNIAQMLALPTWANYD